MEPKLFDEIVERRLKMCEEVLIYKSKQYTRNNDKLHNFRQTARRDGITMIEALHGMMAKHVQSYYDIKQDLIDGKEISQHTLDEKFTDLLNYHLLAEAIVVEHNNKLVGKELPDPLADHIRTMNQRVSSHRNVQDATEKFLAESKRINAEYKAVLDATGRTANWPTAEEIQAAFNPMPSIIKPSSIFNDPNNQQGG